ncbi:MAG: peptidylprolyl isomerase [Paracoccaceae bacterium]|nr:MAG: peptidylprolyl isomerase [Paracoccaceae bacterium]
MKRAILGAVMAVAMGAGGSVAAQTSDTVVATVNGRTITLGHMIVLREALPQQYQALPDDVLFKGILDQLIQQSVLEQSVEDQIGLRDRLSMENDRRGYLSGVALRAVIGGAVTDAALQAAYDARFKDAAPQTEYNAAHILVDTQEKAAELKSQIDGGADFAELARANSTDPGSGPRGGDLGWFGLGQMVKPFEDAVVALTPGAVSDPVQSQFGWHVIRLAETRIASAPSLDDMRDELAAEIERGAVEAHIDALTQAADVTRAGEGIDPALLRDLTLLDK